VSDPSPPPDSAHIDIEIQSRQSPPVPSPTVATPLAAPPHVAPYIANEAEEEDEGPTGSAKLTLRERLQRYP
jgi:hypothetical protein